MRVLVFGTYDAGAHPRVATLAEGLRECGFEVDECNAPLRLDTAARVAMLRRPWRLPLLGLRIGRSWAALARAARRLPAPDAVVVGYLGLFDVHAARRLFPRVPVVLDHLTGAADTAQDRRLAGRGRRGALRAVDAAALRAADIVLVDTDEHLAALPDRLRDKGLVAAVGAPRAWFDAARPAELAAGAARPLRVVFFGLYTPLQGAPVIGAALARLAGAPVEVTMVGHGQDEEATRLAAAGNDAVTWRDWVPPAELPDLVAGHDVCLGVFGTGPKALRVVPNKVYQGAAAGCAVLTSDTPPQRRALDGAALFVPPGDAAALADALRRLAGDPDEVRRLRAAARERALDRFTPGRVVAPLADRLRPAVPAGGRAPSAVPAGRAPSPDRIAPLTPNAWLRFDTVRRMLPGGVSDVLEIGCGQGAAGVRLASRYRYLGVEPDPSSYAVARGRLERLGRGEVRNTTVSALGAERFDLVCAFEVLEHIEDDTAALAEWAGRLRPGGWLMLSVPAHQRRFGPADEMAGHFRRYDPPALAALLRAAGFDQVCVRQYGAPLGYALEAARNAIGRRRLARLAGASPAERTAASGRLLQPDGAAAGLLTRWGTAPFRLAQRALPDAGTGLVARARLAGAPATGRAGSAR
jgi:glycosyltransferase involved in cell wall biosynthesis